MIMRLMFYITNQQVFHFMRPNIAAAARSLNICLMVITILFFNNRQIIANNQL